MAKVVITVDTEEKSVQCNIDGEIFEGLKEVHVHSFIDFEGKPDLHMSLSAEVETDNDGIRKTIHVTNAEGVIVEDKPTQAEILKEQAFHLLGKTQKDKKKKSSSIY